MLKTKQIVFKYDGKESVSKDYYVIEDETGIVVGKKVDTFTGEDPDPRFWENDKDLFMSIPRKDGMSLIDVYKLLR